MADKDEEAPENEDEEGEEEDFYAQDTSVPDDMDEDIEDIDIEDIEEPKMIFGKIPAPGKKVLIIIGVVGTLVLFGGIGFGVYAMGFLDSLLGIEHHEEEHVEEPVDIELGKPIFFEQPEFVADLMTDKCRGSLLKLALTIQIAELDAEILELRQPKIIDRIQQHLRSMTKDDLKGEDGANKLRNEITLIVNGTINPSKVQNILFRSFVVQ
ncbi:MAG: flagellar basal body-associated FliL family protein [Rhodospirillales bacterium]|nr:flagellar basal body-associated FliL family protein [Rhodospirillales bacterium]